MGEVVYMFDLNETPKLSVIMPCKNNNAMFLKSLNSIICQTYKNFELIIITENKEILNDPIVKNIVNDDKRIILIENKDKNTYATALKQGILYSKADYVAFSDNCSINNINRFEKQLGYLKEKELALVCSLVNFISQRNLEYPHKSVTFCEAKLWINFFNPFFLMSALFNKKKLSEKNINILSSLTYAYDYFFIQEIINNDLKAEVMPDILLEYNTDYNNEFSDDNFIANRKISKNEIQYGLLKRFFDNNDEMLLVKNLLENYPFQPYATNNVISALEKIKCKNSERKIVDEYLINKLMSTL